MKQVTMTRDMRPYRANDVATLPDAVADRLVSDGDARDARPWPPQEPAQAASGQPAPAKRYVTKGTHKHAG